MSAPGFWEIAMLAVLALLIFGPDKLPGMAHSLGKTLAHFKREASSTLEELRTAAELEDLDEVTDTFRSTADDFRTTTADLKRSASLKPGTGDKPVSARMASARQDQSPPPFDPDAT